MPTGAEMGPDDLRRAVRCTRKLRMTPADATRALLHLRHDSHGQRRQWRLGDHGSFELGLDFGDHVGPAPHLRRSLRAAGRLWDPSGTTMAGVEVDVVTCGPGAVELSIAPAQRLPEWFRTRDLEHWRGLTRAAVDELGEELLWHAARLARDRPAAS